MRYVFRPYLHQVLEDLKSYEGVGWYILVGYSPDASFKGFFQEYYYIFQDEWIYYLGYLRRTNKVHRLGKISLHDSWCRDFSSDGSYGYHCRLHCRVKMVDLYVMWLLVNMHQVLQVKAPRLVIQARSVILVHLFLLRWSQAMGDVVLWWVWQCGKVFTLLYVWIHSTKFSTLALLYLHICKERWFTE